MKFCYIIRFFHIIRPAVVQRKGIFKNSRNDHSATTSYDVLLPENNRRVKH